MILILHTLIEGIVGLLFLFLPATARTLPGFTTGDGESYDLLLSMYGLAALLLAALSAIGYWRRDEETVYLLTTGTLGAFHFGMTVVQAIYNPDPRVMLLHFLLAIFLSGRYVNRKRSRWVHPEK